MLWKLLEKTVGWLLYWLLLLLWLDLIGFLLYGSALMLERRKGLPGIVVTKHRSHESCIFLDVQTGRQVLIWAVLFSSNVTLSHVALELLPIVIITILSVLCVMSLVSLRIVPLFFANDLPVVELVDICLVRLIVNKASSSRLVLQA